MCRGITNEAATEGIILNHALFPNYNCNLCAKRADGELGSRIVTSLFFWRLFIDALWNCRHFLMRLGNSLRVSDPGAKTSVGILIDRIWSGCAARLALIIKVWESFYLWLQSMRIEKCYSQCFAAACDCCCHILINYFPYFVNFRGTVGLSESERECSEH